MTSPTASAASIGTLSALFLDAEKVFGSRDSCFLALDSIAKAVQSFRGSPQELRAEMMQLTTAVTHMSPRIALLIMMTTAILEQYLQQPVAEHIATEKECLCDIIDDVHNKRRKSVAKLLDYSDGIIETNDTVLIHDISHTVFDILRRAHQRGIAFDVVVAAQEERQTETMVSVLQESDIPFYVAPEYLLAHVLESVTKAFLGAVTINSFHEVISDAGSRAVVAQLLHHAIPVYVPITTDKLSLWQAEQRHHTLKTTQEKSLCGREYTKLVFSHDRYPVDLVTRFITNKGCLEPAALKELYQSYFLQRERWRTESGV